MPESTLPRHIQARVNALRIQHLDALDEALDYVDEALAREASKAIAAIKRSGFRRSTIKSEVRKLSSNGDGLIRQTLAEQMQHAATLADRATDVARAHLVAGDIVEFGDVVAPSALRKAQEIGRAGAEAAIERVKVSPIRSRREVARVLSELDAGAGKRPSTVKGLETIDQGRHVSLSRRISGSSAELRAQTEKEVTTAIREGQTLDEAGREVVRMAKTGSGDLSKPLKAIKRSARRLRDIGGDEAAAEFKRDMRRLERYASKLSDKRGGYREFMQIVEKRGAEGVDKALERWLSEKQRYHAERIVKTETDAAYRAREAKRAIENDRVVAAIWRMNKGARRNYVRRTKVPRKGKSKGHRCVCEQLEGKRFDKEAMREYPRMGHPHCNCWWELVYSSGRTGFAGPSDEDLEWFDSLEP